MIGPGGIEAVLELSVGNGPDLYAPIVAGAGQPHAIGAELKAIYAR